MSLESSWNAHADSARALQLARALQEKGEDAVVTGPANNPTIVVFIDCAGCKLQRCDRCPQTR